MQFTIATLSALAALSASATLAAPSPKSGAAAAAAGNANDLFAARDGNAATEEKRSFSIPLKRYDAHYAKTKRHWKTPEEVIEFARRQKAYVLGKYVDSFNQTNKEFGAFNKKRQSVGLTDVGPDSYYFAQVSVGTPPQNLAIVLDTGSADFWVPAGECTSTNCAGLAKFNENSSSTYQSSNQGFQIQYGQGAVQGHMAADTVSLAGYTVNSQSFAVATNIADNTLTAPASGLMGMGFQQLASSGVTPFWEVLVKQNKLQDNAFSFQLARNLNVQSADEQNAGGVFTLGQIDSNQYTGDINYVNIPQQIQQIGYWAITLDSIQLNGGNNVQIGAVAAIDTGTTLIGVPLQIASQIYQAIPNSQPFTQLGDGYYAYPCSTNVQIAFTFGGKQYTANPQDFNSGAVDASGRYCLGSVFGIDTGGAAPPFIIGDAFLKSVFSVYRYNPPSIGFASLKGNNAQTLSTTGGIAQPTASPAAAQGQGSGAGGATIGPQATRSMAEQATGTSIYAASGVSMPSAAGSQVRSNSNIGGSSSSGSGSTKSSASPSLSAASGVLGAFLAIAAGSFATLIL